MAMTREELFEAAKKKREKEREEENRGRSSFGGYEDINYVAIPSPGEGDLIIRLIGNPLGMRQNPTDPVEFNFSFITGDSGKKFVCRWPEKTDHPDWILWKIYDKVMSYTYDKSKDAKVYHYADKFPSIFNRVNKNNLVDNKLEKGWKPKKLVAMNCIDRANMDWHKSNKITKILSRNVNESNGNFYYDSGVPEYLYRVIWDSVVEYSGDYQEYDIAVRRVKDVPYYEAFHGVDDVKKIKNDLEYVKSGPITEEELSWGRYNLDMLTKATNYKKIKDNLSKFISHVDVNFNTDFLDELNALVEKEKIERDNEVADAISKSALLYVSKDGMVTPAKTTTAVASSSDDWEGKVEKEVVSERKKKVEESSDAEPEIKTRTSVTSKEIPWDKLANGSYNGKTYFGVPLLTEEEKSAVISVKEDGSFEYVKEHNGNPVSLLKNPSSGFVTPGFFHVDCLSGEKFE